MLDGIGIFRVTIWHSSNNMQRDTWVKSVGGWRRENEKCQHKWLNESGTRNRTRKLSVSSLHLHLKIYGIHSWKLDVDFLNKPYKYGAHTDRESKEMGRYALVKICCHRIFLWMLACKRFLNQEQLWGMNDKYLHWKQKWFRL